MITASTFKSELRQRYTLVFAGVLVILLYRLLSSTLLSQMQSPPYLYAETELFYKWILASGVPQFITSHFAVAVVFDVALFLLPILFIVTLRRVFAIAFTILLLTYFVTFNMVTGHHYHSLVGAIIITIPFWFAKPERFTLAWEGVRYYLLYIFASAALWKILRGTVFYTDQLPNILKAQQLDLLLQNPDSLRAHSVQYLISHPPVAHMVLIANVLLQLFFLIGFFTKRFDRALLWLAVFFCIGNYYVMSIISAELLILCLTLLDWEKVVVYGKFKLTTKAQENTEVH